MHRHTSICCKLLGTCVFSGFKKQFLGAERQYLILLLAGKPGLTYVKADSYVHSSRADPYSVCATDNARTDSSHLPIPRAAFISLQISLVVQI